MIHTDMIALFEGEGVGVFGEDLYWGNMPPDPDEVIVGFDAPGPAGLYTKTGRAREEARVQVLARASDYSTAMSRAVEVYDLLDDHRWSTGGISYHCRAVQRPFDVGAVDGTDRIIISCNYSLTLMEG
jgi:hypothetical protein